MLNKQRRLKQMHIALIALLNQELNQEIKAKKLQKREYKLASSLPYLLLVPEQIKYKRFKVKGIQAKL